MRWKLALIAVLASLPGIVLLYLLIAEKSISIDLTQQEIAGEEFLRPLRTIVEHLPSYRTLAQARISGETTGPEELKDREEKLDRAFLQLQEAGQRSSETALAKRAENLATNWERLKGAVSRSMLSNGQRIYSQMLVDIRGMIPSIYEGSRLAVDPDLDAYYLAQIAVVKVFAGQHLLTELLATCMQYAGDRTISADERNSVIARIGLADSNLREIQEGIQNAVRHNPQGNIGQALAKPVEQAVRTREQFLNLVTAELVNMDSKSTQSAAGEFEVAGLEALNTGFGLWDVCMSELDFLLNARITSFQRRKLFAVAGVGSIILFSTLLVLSISRRVNVRIRRLAEAANMIASQPEAELPPLDELQSFHSSDEVGVLADSFMKMTFRLHQYIGELQKTTGQLEDYSKMLEQKVEEAMTLAKECRLMADALLDNEEKFRAVADTANDALLSTDCDGNIMYANRAAELMFGVSADSIVGSPAETLLPERLRTGSNPFHELLSMIDEGRATGRTLEMAGHRSDGAEFPMEVSASSWNAGEDRFLSIFIRDITERKRAEERLEDYSRTLEYKVEQRTQELQDKNRQLESAVQQLRHTQDQLVVQEKMASLGALTAGIAHEIKNPLNFVNNFAQFSAELADELERMLAEQWANPSTAVGAEIGRTLAALKQQVTKINEHGQRADSIVRGMLLHSRGKAGHRESTDLNALIADHANLAYHGMRAHEPTFNCAIYQDYDPSVGTVSIVPQDMTRVFLNIVNNACFSIHEKSKRMRDGFAPAVWISTKDLGDHVAVRIRDNGDGIPEAIIERIFDPFFTTKPAGVGTGLGLSISYEIIVKQHCGELQVESKEGEFAEFVISLPRKGE